MWHFRNVVAGLVAGQGRCIKWSVQSARKNVKSLSNRAGIVQYTAKSVSQSAKTAAVKT